MLGFPRFGFPRFGFPRFGFPRFGSRRLGIIMANAAPPDPAPPLNRLVVALAYDGLCTFEFGIAVEVFGLERPEMGPDWYRFAVAALESGPLWAVWCRRVTRPAFGC